MLSIDITDKQVKIVRGSLNGAKIRVVQVEQRDVPSGTIQNGFITDIPLVASEIAEVLATLDIKDKDTIVCINSSLIINKELILPKQKNLKNTFGVESMIQSNMNISNDYNISYQIIGETKDANDNPMMKVIATACPQRLVDGYVRLFSHLGLTLKSINISNNCITRLVMHDSKLDDLMPLLLVQVDEDFLNINLYDESQLVISRFIKIEKSDYNYDNDYVHQAIYDNIFQMIQFMDSRQNKKPIKEIMFYGKIPDFIALSNAISSFNTPCHIMGAPNNVVTFCEMEFAEYANAIGAFFRPRKELDHVNLLLSSSAKEKKSIGSYPIILGVSVLAAVALVAGGTFALKSINSSITSQTDSINNEISSPELSLRAAELQTKIIALEQVATYGENLSQAKQIFDYMPKIYTQVVDKLESELITGMNLVDDLSISEYAVSANFTCKNEGDPAAYVQKLVDQGYFQNVTFTGYEKDEKTDLYSFNLTMLLKGGNGLETE